MARWSDGPRQRVGQAELLLPAEPGFHLFPRMPAVLSACLTTPGEAPVFPMAPPGSTSGLSRVYVVDVNPRSAVWHKQPGSLCNQQQNWLLFLRSDCLCSSGRRFHLNFMYTRSDPIETAGADRNAADSRERSGDASGPAARAHKRHAAHQAAAAAEFERLKARLRQLVGTNNTMR
jgi:hypothetical protein